MKVKLTQQDVEDISFALSAPGASATCIYLAKMIEENSEVTLVVVEEEDG